MLLSKMANRGTAAIKKYVPGKSIKEARELIASIDKQQARLPELDSKGLKAPGDLLFDLMVRIVVLDIKGGF